MHTPPHLPSKHELSPSLLRAHSLALSRGLRDTVEMQSASARFLSELARQATVPEARKLLLELARIEQLLSLEIDVKVAQLVEAPLPARASPGAANIKTAPEWAHLELITYEQAIAVTLDCTRRSILFLTDMANRFDGPTLDFFLMLAQSDEDRAAMLERALNRRLAELTIGHDIRRVLVEIHDAARRAAKAYAWIGRRTMRPRAQEFLQGMQEVCALHAANIQSMLGNMDHLSDDPVFEGLAAATLSTLDGDVEGLDFQAALRIAMHAQQRTALVHGMYARAFRGEEAQQLLDIADAERRQAATIASVLERLEPSDQDMEEQYPQARSPRESWTCPAIVDESEALDEPKTPVLRLVAG